MRETGPAGGGVLKETRVTDPKVNADPMEEPLRRVKEAAALRYSFLDLLLDLLGYPPRKGSLCV